MSKFFIYLSVMILVVGLAGAVYLNDLEQSKAEQIGVYKAQAVKSAGSISGLVKRWRKLVVDLAKAAPMAEASEDWLVSQKSVNKELTSLALYAPNHLQIDQAKTPPLGYAGLGLLRSVETSKRSQMPEVHMRGSEGEHVAILAPVLVQKNVVAVLLATFDVNELLAQYKEMQSSSSDVLFELKQSSSVIQAVGDNAQTQSEVVAEVFIPGTRWRVSIRKAFKAFPLTAIDVLFYAGILLAITILIGVAVGVLSNQERKKALLEKVTGNHEEGGHKTLAQAVLDDKAVEDELASLAIEPAQSQTTNPIFLKEGSIEVGDEVPKSIFRAYDIRGVVDETLTESLVTKIGQAIGSEVKKAGKKKVVIGRDGRLHSLRLSGSLAKGLQASGCDVIDVGQVPTPVLYFATHHIEEATSGVMITGSHNPPEYNGLKIVIDGITLSGDSILGLYERVLNHSYEEGDGAFEKQMMLPDYIGTISADVRVGRMMKVVVDCGNGVAGEAAPMLLSTLGCEVVPLYCDIDGNFPNHHPDPSKPENLEELIQKVREEGAELGLAFDGDGDRLGVVDADGNIIWPDRQMMLYAADVLSRQAGADIIFDVKCSKNLAKEIARLGGKPVMSKTGHSLIKAKMKETNAELAGEMSGHIFFKERWYGFDDALYTAARLVEILSADFRSSTEIFAELPDSISTPELNVLMEEGENFEFIDKMLAEADFDDAKVVTIDGLRVEFMDGWGLVRASNTTPSLVLRFEADTEEALETIKNRFREMMLRVKPDIELPF
ncbi:MAG: phosphomannomutase/phosphoglucomutase [Piscirickettsiaceae bacterium]|nr:MAG: phosphomannomutase/phosphoglucomutase [Piscirickettsiaceae bacterium]